MRTLYTIFLSTLFICTAASYARAGAWSMNKGGLYAKLSYNHYYTNYTFTDGGGTQRLPNGTTFTDNNTTLYLEYGITDRLTMSGSLPYKWLRSTFRQQVTAGDQTKTRKKEKRWNGFGDMELGLKYCFLAEPVVTSVQFLYKNAWLYEKDENIPPGNHQDDYELRFLAGKSLWPFPGYCGVEIGYRWRTQAPADEFRYLLEFGVNATRKVAFRVKLDGTKSMHNAELPPQPQPVTTAYIDEETGRVIKTGSSSSSQSVSANPSLGLQYDLGKLELTTSYQIAKDGSANCHTPIIRTEKISHPGISIQLPLSTILTIKRARRHH